MTVVNINVLTVLTQTHSLNCSSSRCDCFDFSFFSRFVVVVVVFLDFEPLHLCIVGTFLWFFLFTMPLSLLMCWPLHPLRTWTFPGCRISDAQIQFHFILSNRLVGVEVVQTFGYRLSYFVEFKYLLLPSFLCLFNYLLSSSVQFNVWTYFVDFFRDQLFYAQTTYIVRISFIIAHIYLISHIRIRHCILPEMTVSVIFRFGVIVTAATTATAANVVIVVTIPVLSIVVFTGYNNIIYISTIYYNILIGRLESIAPWLYTPYIHCNGKVNRTKNVFRLVCCNCKIVLSSSR